MNKHGKSLEDLNSKIKVLKHQIGKSDDIIVKGDREALERQHLSNGAISSMVNTLKEAIEENMFSQSKSDEEVKTWAQTPEEILAEADQCVRKLTHEINNLDAVAQEALTRKEEQQKLEFKKRLTEQKLQQEKEAAEVKRMLDFEHQQKLQEVQSNNIKSSSTNSSQNAQIDHFEVHWYPSGLGEILGSV